MAGEGALKVLAEQSSPVVPRRRWYASLFKDPYAVFGCAILLTLAVIGVLAPRLAPFDPPEANDHRFFLNKLAEAHSPPFWDRRGDAATDFADIFEERRLPYDPQYKLGTDWERRDMLSLLLYGTRFSLAVGLLAVALVAVIGAALGLVAGWLGGAWGEIVTRAADLTDAIPAVLAYTLLAAIASDPLSDLFASVGLYLDAVPATAIVLACVGWAPVARLVRGQVLSLTGREWVLAARATGVSDKRIMLGHVLPHTAGPVLVAASSQLPAMLLADGLLGAVGIGRRPSVDSLGELIFHQFAHTVEAPIFVLMPTALVLAISLAVSALSDGVQKALDPQTAR